MAEQPGAAVHAPVTDNRPAPRGVLPRGIQTWLMAALALGIVLIVLLAGHPEPPARPAAAAAAPQAPSADRVRDYQDRLRALEARAALEAQAQALEQPPPRQEVYEEPRPRAPEDPLLAERRRREYESLFASNVVLSRRPEPQRPDAGTNRQPAGAAAMPSEPSIDDIADAVVRATTRASGVAPVVPSAATSQMAPPIPASAGSADRRTRPERTEATSPAGPLHRVPEGTLNGEDTSVPLL